MISNIKSQKICDDLRASRRGRKRIAVEAIVSEQYYSAASCRNPKVSTQRRKDAKKN
jgi:hypothetical protein